VRSERLHFSGDPEADELIVREPLALLIGFVLDQQVTVQTAFYGPLELKRRLGGALEAKRIAAMDEAELEEIFTRRPRLHRYARMMSRRTHQLCQAIAREYDGDAQRVWTETSDARDLERRLLALPGIGPMKARTIVGILGRRLGVRPRGWEEVAPDYPTLADVDSEQALLEYQAGKRAARAAAREQEERSRPGRR
jgi:uncharacterized HhH-GPD family protein